MNAQKRSSPVAWKLRKYRKHKIEQRKRGRQKTISSVGIDYMELAGNIEKTPSKPQQNPERKEAKPGFLKAIFLILRGKVNTGETLTLGLLSLPLAALFRILAVIIGVLLPIAVYASIKWSLSIQWTGLSVLFNISTLLVWGSLGVAACVYAIFLWGASKELETTEDKEFVTSVFSGVVSLAALIVALIALRY